MTEHQTSTVHSTKSEAQTFIIPRTDLGKILDAARDGGWENGLLIFADDSHKMVRIRARADVVAILVEVIFSFAV